MNLKEYIDNQVRTVLKRVREIEDRLRVNRVRNPTLTEPPGVIDGDLWIEAVGTSPTRTVNFQYRDNGVTRTIFTDTY